MLSDSCRHHQATPFPPIIIINQTYNLRCIELSHLFLKVPPLLYKLTNDTILIFMVVCMPGNSASQQSLNSYALFCSGQHDHGSVSRSGLYYNATNILKTTTWCWTWPTLLPEPHPTAWKAHAAIFYKGKVWAFGGGSGLTTLNDVWTLEVGPGRNGMVGLMGERLMHWEEVEMSGWRPGAWRYHTATLIWEPGCGNWSLYMFRRSIEPNSMLKKICVDILTVWWVGQNFDEFELQCGIVKPHQVAT